MRTWTRIAVVAAVLLSASRLPGLLLAAERLGAPKAIVVRDGASAVELFAANEIRRYAYLRTGTLLPIRHGKPYGDCIAVSAKNQPFCGELGSGLLPQWFVLRTTAEGRHRTWWVIGGDELGTLYGAYRFAEHLGVRYGVDGDAIPDERLGGDWPEVSEAGRPRFALRGLQPFHDFSVGPDWWNLADYQSVLSQLAKLRMNFIGFHTYPSWNSAAGPEANVWIGLPQDVDEQGNVRFGYEAGVVTTRRGWEVRPFPTSKYASGAGLLFEADDYGPDFMLDCLDWPKTTEAATRMFNRYGDLQQKAFGEARRLGIKTCVGTEIPLGVPRELAARLSDLGMKREDPATLQRLYEGTFLRLMRKSPVDYYWLWAPEIWLGQNPGSSGWEVASEANVLRDLGLVEAAARAVKAPFGLATCGWRLGTRENPRWLDQHTPSSWAASAIGTSLGRDAVEPAFGMMTNRPRWEIGWAEDDDTAGAHCCTCWDLQLWAQRMFANSDDAFRYGCEGMMAIHWRTAAIAPTLAALAQAGWEFSPGATNVPNPHAPKSGTRSMEAFWADWGRGQFGGEAGARAGLVLQKLDGGHLGINALIRGGAGTTDAAIDTFFAPLRELESLRPQIRGAGNRERFDYWLNFIRASQLRVETWVMADRLSAKMKEAAALPEAERKRSLVRGQALPLRVKLARSYESMIAAYLESAKSPGDVGTISSIESGSRARVLSAHDAQMADILGEPLPPEASVSSVFRGTPRVFVSAPRTEAPAAAPYELRVFVLSGEACKGVDLFWRPLGRRGFKKITADHRARQAFRVSLPASAGGAAEYYVQATLNGGAKLAWPRTAPALNQTVTLW